MGWGGYLLEQNYKEFNEIIEKAVKKISRHGIIERLLRCVFGRSVVLLGGGTFYGGELASLLVSEQTESNRRTLNVQDMNKTEHEHEQNEHGGG